MLALGARGHRFESCLPDVTFLTIVKGICNIKTIVTIGERPDHAILYKGSTTLFDSVGSGSIPLMATVKSFLLDKMLDCESGNWVRIPASPKKHAYRLTG